MFIISKHSALSSTRQDVFLILTASAAVPPRTQSAAQLPSTAPHDSKARLQDVATRRKFMAKPCTPHLHCAARAVLQATDCQCAGSRGSLVFLWGIQRGYSLRKENTPFGAAARTPLPLRTRAKKRAILSRENLPLCPVQRRRRCPPPALSCRKSKSDGFFSRRFSICITAKPFCCRGWPSCAALC